MYVPTSSPTSPRRLYVVSVGTVEEVCRTPVYLDKYLSVAVPFPAGVASRI